MNSTTSFPSYASVVKDSKTDSSNPTITVFDRPLINQLVSNDMLILQDRDAQTGLELFCYEKCDTNTPDIVKQCRGIIFHGNQLVFKGFPFTDEYPHTDVTSIRREFGTENKNNNLNGWLFHEAYEGTILRMFFYGERWYLSTHRKLNAFKSKWASKTSFGDLFVQALETEIKARPDFDSVLQPGKDAYERLQNTLDKTCQYAFLLRSNEDNRIVCRPPKDGVGMIVHVATYGTNPNKCCADLKLPGQRRMSLPTVDAVLQYVAQNINPADKQGLLCQGPQPDRWFKIVHSEYFDCSQLRGNERSIAFRYLQIRNDEKSAKKLAALYPLHAEMFQAYERYIRTAVVWMYQSYVSRFHEGSYVVVPQEEYKIIREVREWHLKNPSVNVVTTQVFFSALNTQPAPIVNHIVAHIISYDKMLYKKNAAGQPDMSEPK